LHLSKVYLAVEMNQHRLEYVNHSRKREMIRIKNVPN
jgi:hypothetical protein